MISILNSAPALRFRAAAEAFVALVEARATHSPADWLARVHAQLPELYAVALALREVAPDTGDAKQSVMTHDEWKVVYDDIGGVLGRWNYYWDVYDPYSESDHEAVCGSLADDLADIYRDLRDGLFAASAEGARPNDVFWAWRFDFASHWAAHAARAIRALSTAFFVYHADELPELFGPGASSEPHAS